MARDYIGDLIGGGNLYDESDDIQRQVELKSQDNLQNENAFARGVYRGTRGLASTFHGLRGAINSAVGNPAAAQGAFQDYVAQNRMAMTHPKETSFLGGEGTKGAIESPGTFIAETAGELIPSLAESFVTGAAGAAIGSQVVPGVGPDDVVAAPAGFLAGLFGKGMVKSKIRDIATRYATKQLIKSGGQAALKETLKKGGRQGLARMGIKQLGARLGSMALVTPVMGGQEAGGMWAELYDKGIDAPGSSLIMGLISGASESFMGATPNMLKLFKFAAPSIAKEGKKGAIRTAAGMLWDVAKNANEEGVQEGFQEILAMVNADINDPNHEWDKESFANVIESYAAGAVGGGLVGSAGSVKTAIQGFRPKDLETGQDIEAPKTESRNPVDQSQNDVPQEIEQPAVAEQPVDMELDLSNGAPTWWRGLPNATRKNRLKNIAQINPQEVETSDPVEQWAMMSGRQQTMAAYDSTDIGDGAVLLKDQVEYIQNPKDQSITPESIPDQSMIAMTDAEVTDQFGAPQERAKDSAKVDQNTRRITKTLDQFEKYAERVPAFTDPEFFSENESMLDAVESAVQSNNHALLLEALKPIEKAMRKWNRRQGKAKVNADKETAVKADVAMAKAGDIGTRAIDAAREIVSESQDARPRKFKAPDTESGLRQQIESSELPDGTIQAKQDQSSQYVVEKDYKDDGLKYWVKELDNGKFSVGMRDTDVNENLPTLRVFKNKQSAIKYFDEVINDVEKRNKSSKPVTNITKAQEDYTQAVPEKTSPVDEDKRLIEKGRNSIPGIRLGDAREAGVFKELHEDGAISDKEWNDFVEQMKSENRVTEPETKKPSIISPEVDARVKAEMEKKKAKAESEKIKKISEPTKADLLKEAKSKGLDVKPKMTKAEIKAALTEAEKPAKADTKQDPEEKRLIGKNANGKWLYEDGNGVRHYAEGGLLVGETIGIIPGQGISIDKSRRGKDHLTQEEYSESAIAKNKKNREDAEAALKSNGLNLRDYQNWTIKRGIKDANDRYTIRLLREYIDEQTKKSDEKPEQSIKEPAKPKKQFLDNVSEEKQKRAEELKAKLRAKISRTNIGIDPTIISDGAELAAIYIEGGMKNFAEFATEMIDSIGQGIKPSLRAMWNQAGDDNRDLDLEDISRKQADEIFADMETKEESPTTEPEKNSVPKVSDTTFNDEAKVIILSDEAGQRKYAKIKKLAEKADITIKEAQERVELVLVNLSHNIVRNTNDPKKTFDTLVDLYQKQPNFNKRTSTSVKNQAYSTPMPLAFAAGMAIDLRDGGTIYEPTAGNGALVIGAVRNNVHVNELNDVRRENLNKGGYKMVTSEDATTFTPSSKSDHIIQNPPFGSLDKKVWLDGYGINNIDHQIAIKALDAMKDNGTAAIIVGAPMQGRKITGANKVFSNYLRNHYNVTGHFIVDGSLYSKQGASFPVQVITIAGRKANVNTENKNVSPHTVGIAKNWNEVYINLEESYNATQKIREGLQSTGTGDTATAGETGADQQGDILKQPSEDSKTTDTGGKRGGTQVSPESSNGTVRPGRKPTTNTDQQSGLAEDVSKDGDVKRGDTTGQLEKPSTRGDNKRDDGTGRGKRSTPAGPIKLSRDNTGIVLDKVEEVTDTQVKNKPISEAMTLNTVMPKNMYSPFKKFLKRLEQKVGNIDAYVQEELGYKSKADLYKAMAAEQIEGFAAAIYNLKNNNGMIIGDETGIGKGRQAAAAVVWAKRNGLTPIFFTKDANLFSDLYRDISDIGHDFNPLMMGETLKSHITDANDKVIKRAMSGVKQKQFFDKFKGDMGNYDSIIATYSQISKYGNKQQAFFTKLVDSGKVMLIMDESHMGAGENSTTGLFLRGGEIAKGSGENQITISFPGLLRNTNTKGAVYLSATYAKHAGSMPLYMRTNIANAVEDLENLTDIFQGGGVAMQQVVAGELAADGQMTRREKDFSDAKFNIASETGRDFSEMVKEVDAVTESLREIIKFSEIVGEAIEATQDDTRATSTVGQIDRTDFSSTVHNKVRQMLLASKADAVADMAIEAFKAGQKPVIALESTMGTFIGEYAADEGLDIGDTMPATFKDVIQVALDRTLRATRDNGDDTTTKITYTPDQLGIQAEYDMVAELIADMDIELPMSPIDRMIYKMEKAGIKVGEITGRSHAINYTSETEGTYKRRTKKEIDDRNPIINGFNKGTIDAIILNTAGSTGLSLHATPKNDGKPRHMIIAQPALNINVFMQMLGRIKRSGMIPGTAEYTIFQTSLQAEKRPMSVLATKLKSLLANTTADADSGVKIEAPDMFNKYGDRSIAKIVGEEPDLQDILNLQISTLVSGAISDSQPAGLLKKATGRMALLSDKDQIGLYERIEQEYNTTIEFLKNTNQYDLEIQDYSDWDAKTLNSSVIQPGTDQNSVFTADVVVETVSAKNKTKPPTPADYDKEFKKNFGAVAEGQETISKTLDEIRQKSIEFIGESPDTTGMEEEKAKRLNDKYITKKNDISRKFSFITDYANRVSRSLGKQVIVSMGEDRYVGSIINFSYKEGAGSPVALSKYTVDIIVNDSIRRISIPFSQIGENVSFMPTGRTAQSTFSEEATIGRQDRKVLTGNIVKGFEFADKGQVITYQTDQGEQKMGILMPKSWSESDMKRDPRKELRSGKAVKRYLDSQYYSGAIRSTKGFRIYYRDGQLVAAAPSSKIKGGRFYLNDNILAITGDWTKIGREFRVEIDKSDIEPLADIVINEIKDPIQPSGVKVDNSEDTQRDVDQANQYRRGESNAKPLSKADRQRVKALSRQLLGNAVRVDFVDKITTPDGQNALGNYKSAMIKLANKQASPEDTTMHEAVHAVLDLFLSDTDKDTLTKAAGNEEMLAEGIIRYANTRKGFTGRARQILNKFLRMVKSFFTPEESNRAKVDRFYDLVLGGKFANQGQSTNTPGDVKYRLEELRKDPETFIDGIRNHAMDWVNSFKEPVEIDGKRQDLTKFDRLVRTPMHAFAKIPQLKRMFEAAVGFGDDKHKYGEMILGENEVRAKQIADFAKTAEFDKFNDRMYEKDRNAIGYRVNEVNGEFQVQAPPVKVATHTTESEAKSGADMSSGWYQRNDQGNWDVYKSGEVLQMLQDEDTAWEVAYAKEAADFKAEGFSDQAVETLLNYRRITHEGHRQLKYTIDEITKILESNGTAWSDLDIPSFSQSDGTITDLFEMLKMMGDRRGYYMPRLRDGGRFLVFSYKDGANPMMETFVSESAAQKHVQTMKRKGYNPEIKPSNTPSEQTFVDTDIVAMNDLIQNSLEAMKKSNKDAQLGDFGIKGEFIDYKTKDGKTEKHFIFSQPKGTWAKVVFKRLGAGRYKAGQKTDSFEAGDQVWHIKTEDKDFPQKVAQALHLHQYGVIKPVSALAESFTKQVATMIHARGSRSAKIGRSDRTGIDVFEGYEKDSRKAVIRSAKSIAGGTAKRTMAKKMQQIMTGTEKSWNEFLEENTEEGMTNPELYQAYQEMVQEKRIDSATQKEAFEAATVFMKDMLRNTQPIERYFDKVRGAMSVWFLSGFGSGFVNMTALLTNVPAVFQNDAGMNPVKTVATITKAIPKYVGFLKHLHNPEKHPNKLKGDDAWVFQKIRSLGMDSDLLNTEAMNALRDSKQNFLAKGAEALLWPFGITEKINRATTIYTAYQNLKNGPKDEDALHRAREMSDRAHGSYGKPNLWEWARGEDLKGILARSFAAYKTFSANYLDVLMQMGYASFFGENKAQARKAAAWMLLSPAVIGGGGATLATTGLSMLASAIGVDEPEEQVYRGIENTLGNYAGQVARGGLAGAAGLNIKGSLAIGITDLPTDLESLLGAPYGFGKQLYHGGENILRGNFVKGAEKLLPRAAAQPIKALREGFEGVTTRYNQPVYYGDEQIKLDWYQMLIRATLVAPADPAYKREKIWMDKKVSRKYQEIRTGIYEKMRRHVLNGGSMTDWGHILIDIKEYNADIADSKFIGLTPIKPAQIKNLLRKMDRPEKRERLRAQMESFN